jgi:hypothetical protein
MLRPRLHILHVQLLDVVELPLQGRFDLLGEHGHPVLAAFAVTHDAVMGGAVNILHPQAQTRQETQASAIQ